MRYRGYEITGMSAMPTEWELDRTGHAVEMMDTPEDNTNGADWNIFAYIVWDKDGEPYPEVETFEDAKKLIDRIITNENEVNT